MESYIRILLPIYGVVFLFVIFFLRTVLVWKRTGVNAYVLLKNGGAQGVIGRYFKILPYFSGLVIVLYSFYPEHYHLLAPFVWLENQWTLISGVVLLAITMVFIWVSQTQMGNSWRIGVDEDAKTELVTSGVFQISRNPIFLGMKLNSLGLFLIAPNAITLLVLVVGAALIDVQVAMEEKYLEATHGDEYIDYCKQVRRWV